MKFLDSAKEKIREAAEKRAEQKAEAERLRIIQEKESNKLLIQKLQEEAKELGLTLAEYIGLLNYKEQNRIATKIDEMENEISNLRFSISNIENGTY